MKKYFITAIGTGCGKTLASAILCEATGYDYWKPVQSGLDDIDKNTVSALVQNPKVSFHNERFLLKTPVSPHQSADLDGVSIKLEDFILPPSNNNLIIEGAGGVLVPLNFEGDFVIDIAAKFDCEIVLVASLYLGSINHTLLTLQELKRRKLSLKGVIFNGEPNQYSQKIITQMANCPTLLHIMPEKHIDNSVIKKYVNNLIWN